MKNLFLFIILSIPCIYGSNPKTSKSIQATNVKHVIWNGNQISTVHGNHGDISSFHVTSLPGTEWPKGSGKTVIFQSGLWVASGKVRTLESNQWRNEIRTAAVEYISEFSPGSFDGITNDGHIYEIHRVELDAFLDNDFATYSAMSAPLPVTVFGDATIETELVETPFPTKDFENWPVEAGAPWVDANRDGFYNIEDGDHPDILGDMFHWYVMNDRDPVNHQSVWQTKPMNIEVQTSLFGFDRSGPFENIVFVRWVLINRGPDDLDSVFVSIWHDDDLGSYSDDLVGCDTVLSIGYTYNDDDGDNVYGIEVPAVASDFFQGPLVESDGSVGSILTWSLGDGYHVRTIQNKKRLGLTSFVKYSARDPIHRDPFTAKEAYNYMNGRIGPTNEYYINPSTGNPSTFVHPGDPTSGAGWVDNSPGDRRYLMSSGPFYFGSGDTVEVVGSIIVADGPNWKKSISKLKYSDKFAQGSFDANFGFCSWPIPEVVASQLNERVILSFQEDSEVLENHQCAQYQFQGYNLYQGESENGPWHLIKTYDIVDRVKAILEWHIDERTGFLVEYPAQYGTDSGITRYFDITEDTFTDTSLINHRKYFYSVTAYAYDPDAAPRIIESPIYPIEVVPGLPGVGYELNTNGMEVLFVSHNTGMADAIISPIVITPYALNNLEYAVSIESIDSATSKWVLRQGEDTILEGTDFPVTQDYYGGLISSAIGVDPVGSYINNKITEGFIFNVERGYWTIEKHDSATTISDSNDSTQIVFNGVGSGGTDDASWYGFMKYISDAYTQIEPPAGKPSLADLQLDLELRFNEKGSIATYYHPQTFRGQIEVDTILIPFELWTVEDNKRINAAVYQVAGPRPDKIWESVGDGVESYQFTSSFQFIPVYTQYDGSIVHYSDDTSIMGWLLNFNKYETQFEYGNVFHIQFRNPLIPGNDVYTFKALGLNEASNIKSQLDKINVFPNPYFGQNPEEINPQDRKVFFTHLGVGTTTIRIFTISGDLVTRINKVIESENSPDNRAEWNLRNKNGLLVASGMYLAHIIVEDEQGKKIGERILKLAVFQPAKSIGLF